MVQFLLKIHFEFFLTKETPMRMASSRGSQYIFLFLLSLVVSSTCTTAEKLEGGIVQVFHPSRRGLLESFHFKSTQHDLVNPPVTNYPTTPVVTNPVTTPSIVPPDNSAPTVVTVPATNPIGVTPNPVATPATIPPATLVPVPATNPVTPAVPVTNPVTTPVTNPVTTPTAPGALPVTNPTPAPVTTNAPAIPGQSWCVAKSGTSETALQAAIDYACGMGGADCSAIQQGGICYNPNTLQNHASVAFNSYFQKNPTQTSCDFGGTALITNANPSSGSCVFATLSSSSSSPAIAPPTTATTSGATPTGSGAPPTVLNTSYPTTGGTSTGFGDSPPTSSTLTSISNRLRSAIGCILLVITFTFTRITVF